MRIEGLAAGSSVAYDGAMRAAIVITLAALILAYAPGPTAAKDFPEPVLAADPLAAASRPGLPAGMGGSFEYGNYAVAHDDVDSFYLRLSASPVFFRLGDAFALGGSYESVLMCGPVAASDTAANIAAFWMNAIQFEYGLYASFALPGLGPRGPHILAEYARTSQHPFVGRTQYSEVSADILMTGIAFPELRLGSFSALSYLRLGYRDLFDFWQSELPKPRVWLVAKPAIEARYPINEGGIFAVARAYPEIFIDRYKEALDANIFAETGIAFGKGQDSAEILFTIYGTRDSDLLRNSAHPTFEAGISFRFSSDRAGLPGSL
jgi:hypothetical protein